MAEHGKCVAENRDSMADGLMRAAEFKLRHYPLFEFMVSSVWLVYAFPGIGFLPRYSLPSRIANAYNCLMVGSYLLFA